METIIGGLTKKTSSKKKKKKSITAQQEVVIHRHEDFDPSENFGIYHQPILKHQTPCCALCQMYNTNNFTTEKEINTFIEKLKYESSFIKWKTDDRRSGERAIYTMTSPHETKLAETLIKCGFRKVADLNRRHGYPEGLIGMYLYNF